MIPATEVSYKSWISDLLVYDVVKKYTIEVEVKISKSDLLSEKVNKEDKHNLLNEEANNCPNKFYYCVPENLKEDALNLISEINPNYGLLICEEIRGTKTRFCEKIVIVIAKQAKLLHTKINEKLQMTILKRLSSEVCNLYTDLFLKEKIN